MSKKTTEPRINRFMWDEGDLVLVKPSKPKIKKPKPIRKPKT